ncbi:hypothetical protein Dimus_018798, partial [Dionaea muscipula]
MGCDGGDAGSGFAMMRKTGRRRAVAAPRTAAEPQPRRVFRSAISATTALHPRVNSSGALQVQGPKR